MEAIPWAFSPASGHSSSPHVKHHPEEPHLAWHATPPHAARLWCREPDPEVLAAALFAALMDKAGPTPESVTGTKSFKDLTLQLCRASLTSCHLTAPPGRYASDPTAKDRPVSGALAMTGGPQDFTAEVAKLRAAVKTAGPAAIRPQSRPRQYEEGHPLGFDPLMERQHGYLGAKPERDSRRVPGAVLLAVTALRTSSSLSRRGARRHRQCLLPRPPLADHDVAPLTPPLALRAVESLAVSRATSQNALPSEGIFAEFGAERKRCNRRRQLPNPSPGEKNAVKTPHAAGPPPRARCCQTR